VIRKGIFLVFASVILLSLLTCCGGSSSSIGGSDSSLGTNGRSVGGSGGSINSIGGSGAASGGRSVSSTPAHSADVIVSLVAPSMAVGETLPFTATTKNAPRVPIHWASSAPNVATINNSGVATGVSAGITQITATAGGVSSPPVVLTLCDFRHL